VSVDSLPPDIGAMLRDLRRRVFELERKRPPIVRGGGVGATYRWGTASTAIGPPMGSGSPFFGEIARWEFHTPTPAYVLVSCTLYAVNNLSMPGGAGQFGIGLELKINDDCDGGIPFTDHNEYHATGGEEVPMAIQCSLAVAAGGPHAITLHAEVETAVDSTGYVNLNGIRTHAILFPIDPDALDMSTYTSID